MVLGSTGAKPRCSRGGVRGLHWRSGNKSKSISSLHNGAVRAADILQALRKKYESQQEGAYDLFYSDADVGFRIARNTDE